MKARSEDSETVSPALRAALKLLSQRAYSERTLRDKLHSKGFSPSDIRDAVDFCRRKNFINDREFAKLFIEQRLETRPRAGHVLVGELMKRGIALKLAKEMVEACVSTETETESANTLATKKWKQCIRLGPDVCFRRVSGYLARRGYNWDTITSAIKHAQKNHENQERERE